MARIEIGRDEYGGLYSDMEGEGAELVVRRLPDGTVEFEGRVSAAVASALPANANANALALSDSEHMLEAM